MRGGCGRGGAERRSGIGCSARTAIARSAPALIDESARQQKHLAWSWRDEASQVARVQVRLARLRLRSGEEARGPPRGSDHRTRNGSEAEKSRSRFSGSPSGGEGAGREPGRKALDPRLRPPFGASRPRSRPIPQGGGGAERSLLPPWGRTLWKPMAAAEGLNPGKEGEGWGYHPGPSPLPC